MVSCFFYFTKEFHPVGRSLLFNNSLVDHFLFIR
jgi:hypothetical protein